jgi:hypothetical protein
MATGQGTATIDFGALASDGSNEASIAVTGQATISATSKAEAYVMADDTSTDHNANDHRYFVADAGLSCGTPTASTGFTIYAYSRKKLTGKYTIRWVWAD